MKYLGEIIFDTGVCYLSITYLKNLTNIGIIIIVFFILLCDILHDFGSVFTYIISHSEKNILIVIPIKYHKADVHGPCPQYNTGVVL